MITKKAIGAQLYTLRDFLRTPEEIEQSLARVKSIGYDTVQLSGLGPVEPRVLRDILERTGLAAPSSHTSFEQIRDDPSGVAARHELWGSSYVGIGSMPVEFRSAEGHRRFARLASESGRILARNGLKLIYHNHRFEFERLGGRTGLEILLEESDPGALFFEPDTYWIQAGGGDPAAWIRRMAGRVPMVHLKDMSVLDDEQIMAEVGEGNLNWAAILHACEEAGVEWYLVEQDDCRRDPMDSLAISLANLERMIAS